MRIVSSDNSAGGQSIAADLQPLRKFPMADSTESTSAIPFIHGCAASSCDSNAVHVHHAGALQQRADHNTYNTAT